MLEYDHLLPKDGETIELLYPLNTEKFSAKPLRDVRVDGGHHLPDRRRRALQPEPRRHGDAPRCEARAVVNFQAREVRPETDFLLYWGESAGDVGATLLTHWPRGEDRGYFLFLASPTLPDAAAQAARRRT